MTPNGILVASDATHAEATGDLTFVSGELRLGGASQTFVGVDKIATFRKDANTAVSFIVENPNTGDAATASLFLLGEPTATPVANARYLGLNVISEGYVNPPLGAQVPVNCAFIQSGGSLNGGMMLYVDDGPLQLSNEITPGALPRIYISPFSLVGVTQPFPGCIGMHNNDPKAVVDIAASTTERGSLRLRSGVAPTGDGLVDGTIWYDGANLKMRVGGTTKTFTLI